MLKIAKPLSHIGTELPERTYHLTDDTIVDKTGSEYSIYFRETSPNFLDLGLIHFDKFVRLVHKHVNDINDDLISDIKKRMLGIDVRQFFQAKIKHS